MTLSPHFALAELTRTSRSQDNTPTPEHVAALTRLCVDVLEPIRALLGVPLRINSGYRSAAVNEAIGGAEGSQHLLGQAADIVPVGYVGGVESAMKLLALEVRAGRLPADQVIVYPIGGFIHVSWGPRNRRQMLRSAARGGSGGPYSIWAG